MSMQPKQDEFVITVRDESVPRSEAVEALLKLASNTLTARDLIAERVRAEFDARLLDKKDGKAFRLVLPGTKEASLNGQPDKIKGDPEAHVQTALAAFEAHAFILLVDDQQVESLDTKIHIDQDTVVTFLKLTPLKGG